MFAPSYFSFSQFNPLNHIDDLMNPQRFYKQSEVSGYAIAIHMTDRAAKALARRDSALLVEMQLYFSCVVQKRLVFHEQMVDMDNVSMVDNKLAISFRAVEADSCDPVTFAQNHPEKREMPASICSNFHPSSMTLDFKNGQWEGTYNFESLNSTKTGLFSLL